MIMNLSAEKLFDGCSEGDGSKIETETPMDRLLEEACLVYF